MVVTQEGCFLLHGGDGTVFVGQQELLELRHLAPQQSHFILPAAKTKSNQNKMSRSQSAAILDFHISKEAWCVFRVNNKPSKKKVDKVSNFGCAGHCSWQTWEMEGEWVSTAI